MFLIGHDLVLPPFFLRLLYHDHLCQNDILMNMNIYFSGLGGVGIGPLVDIALDVGYSVQGSDVSSSLATNHLEKRGVNISIGSQDGQFLKDCHQTQPIDQFIYTAALPEDHPELITARQLGIKTSKRDVFLSQIISSKQLKLIAVSGTHGKTTTTGMIIWTLKQLGVPISYSIGTTVSFGPSGHYDQKSEYFVLECDEYDKNLLHFHPFLSIIPSISYDHPDTYPTKQDYIDTFDQFVAQSEQTIMWQKDSTGLNNINNSAWCLQENEILDLSVIGVHNRQNATLVLKALQRLEIGDETKNIDIIDKFPGTGRRFEKLADNLYSDYGHHPAEIAATLQLARELSDNVVLVYQPHQNKRQHQVKDDYTDQFDLAEKVYWLPTYLTREDPSEAVLSPEELSKNVSNVSIANLDDALWQEIESMRSQGKLVLIMGAGDIDNWVRKRIGSE